MSSSSQPRAIKKPKPHWVKLTYFREVNHENRSRNSEIKREEMVSFTQNPTAGSISTSSFTIDTKKAISVYKTENTAISTLDLAVFTLLAANLYNFKRKSNL